MLYGQTWDVAWDGQFASVTPQQFWQITGTVPHGTDVTFGVHGTVTIGGHRRRPGRGRRPDSVIPAIGMARGTGPVMSPTVLDGRPPRNSGEIVLGTSVLRQFGLRLGQHVRVDTPAGPLSMLITGSAVFPYFGQGSFTSTDVGEGAETVADVLAPQAAASAGQGGGYNFALISFAPGAAKQAGLATFQRRWAPFCATIQQSTCLVTSQRPNTVNNYAAIDGTPAVLAGVLAVLGLGVLAQFTVASARRRRRDYADTQGPRPAPRAAARGRPLAGLGGHRRRPGDRHTARRGGRPLGLAGVRLPGWPVRRRGRPAPGAVARPGRARRHRPGSPARRPPRSGPARHGHPADRVTRSSRSSHPHRLRSRALRHHTPRKRAALPVNSCQPVNFLPEVRKRQHSWLLFTRREMFTGKSGGAARPVRQTSCGSSQTTR